MPDIEISSAIGHTLYRKVWDAARLRLGLEERWFEDTLQYLGKYDSDTEAKLREQKGSSPRVRESDAAEGAHAEPRV